MVTIRENQLSKPEKQLMGALQQILQVEREHLFGSKSGSDTARRSEIQKTVDRIIRNLEESTPSSDRRKRP
jgi:hypothetical protein